MDNAGTRHVDDVRHVVQQSVEQGAIGVPGSRVHHQSSRFVDDQDLLVFVDDIQRDILSNPLTLGFLLGLERQQGTTMDDVARTQHRTVNRHQPLFNPGRQTRTRVLGKQECGDLIEALTAHFIGHLGVQFNDLLINRGHARQQRGSSLWFRLHACG